VARIVHASETLAAGVLSVLSCLAKQQANDGHEVVVIGSRLRADTPLSFLDVLPANVRFIDLPMEREITPDADVRSALRLRNVLHSLAPDVVHLHSSKAGALGRFAAIGLRAQLIYQPHGLASLRQDVSRTRRAAYASIEAGLALLGGTIVACSEGERAELAKVVRGEQVALIWNGIDVAGIPRAKRVDGRLRIGTCGRISAQKQPRFFAHVADTLRNLADFVWIGDGDEEDKQALIEAGVHVSGWCSRAKAVQDLSELQIYIQTSAWEGLPISVIEALAAGLPVIATDIIVRTPEQMISALRLLIGCDLLRHKLGRASRRLAFERYSSSAMMREYYKLYRVT
jgi:glycosyltransferase involved in cell wall biosynthesis